MLRNELYHIVENKTSSTGLEAELEVHPDHPIFKGHFPGQPVLPGVCMIQIIGELLELLHGEKLRMVGAGQIKFLSVIDPLQTPRFFVSLQEAPQPQDRIRVEAGFFLGDTIYFKMQGGIFEKTGTATSLPQGG